MELGVESAGMDVPVLDGRLDVVVGGPMDIEKAVVRFAAAF